MDEWGDSPPTFDRSTDIWGSGAPAIGDEDDAGGGDQYVELIGTALRVAGMVNLGRFRRVSDFVNIVEGYLILKDVVVLTRTGEATRLTFPELRVLPDDVAIVGQLATDRSHASAGTGVFIEKVAHRLVVLTRSHMIDGEVFIQREGSIMSFVDATDPKFIPMSDVRVRWVADRRLAARFPFALLQRKQILGVATEGIKLGGAESTSRRVEILKAQSRSLPVTSEADVVDAGINAEADAAVPEATSPGDL